MKEYLNLLEFVLETGTLSENRTNTQTLKSFGHFLNISLEPFPLITTKKVHFKSVVHELLWFLRGEQSIQYLKNNNIRIWNEWNFENSVGPMYGYQWIHWKNQLSSTIENIRKNPHSRRHVVSAWNVDYLPDEDLTPQENVKNGKMALAPCHVLYQFNVINSKLDIAVYQRSMDLFLGAPFNIASYSLLAYMVAQQCNLNLGNLKYFIGDAHIYVNHIEQIKTQLGRKPQNLPNLKLNKKNSIFEYTYEDIELKDYNFHPPLKGKVAV